MSVFHLDIETFMTAVDRLDDPALRLRPLVIAPERRRATVLAASSDAKALGVTRDMPVDYVRRYFPGLIIKPPRLPRYEQAHRTALAVVHQYSPTVEPIRYGHIALDMTGMRRLYGTLENAALKLTRDIHDQLSLDATIGIAANKLVGRIAAKEIQKEREPLCAVRTGDEPPFLSPLSCKALPGWDDPNVRKTLFELNLREIGQIQRISRDIFGFALGAMGVQLHRHAMGVDPEPVTPIDRSRQLESEHRFTPDTNDDVQLKAAIYDQLEKLCHQLRVRELAADRLILNLKYSDDVRRRRCWTFAHTHQEQDIHQRVLTHFDKLCDRRQRVRSIHLILGGLRPLQRQASLFQAAKDNRVTPHLDAIRRRFGADAVQYGRAALGKKKAVAS